MHRREASTCSFTPVQLIRRAMSVRHRRGPGITNNNSSAWSKEAFSAMTHRYRYSAVQSIEDTISTFLTDGEVASASVGLVAGATMAVPLRDASADHPVMANFAGANNTSPDLPKAEKHSVVDAAPPVMVAEGVDGSASSAPVSNVSITNNHMGTGIYGITDFMKSSPVYTGNLNDGATLASATGFESPVVSLASANAGNYSAGQTLTLTLYGSEVLTVSGTPSLTLNDGGTANYTGGSGTNALADRDACDWRSQRRRHHHLHPQ
jgi:hypothetical protein